MVVLMMPKLKSFLKNYEKVFMNAKLIFWDKPNLLEYIYDFG